MYLRKATHTAVMLALASVVSLAHAGYADPLDVPAMRMEHTAAMNPMNAVTVAGKRMVAAGRRGVILVSEDRGRHWTQAKVPVSVDLTAIHFTSAQAGWAVGHGGVVLHSTDGGLNWTKKLDGRQVAALIRDHYSRPALAGDVDTTRALDDAMRLADEGPIHPFLDVWFEDEKVGYVVGAFNLILKTDDAGKSWQPWMERTANPNGLHLYSVRGDGGEVVVVGEQGLVLRLDRQAQRFHALPKPAMGSLFGVLMQQGSMLVYGLRGNAFHTDNMGRSWQQVKLPVQATLTGGTVLRDGRIVLASQGGQVLIGARGGAAFAPLSVKQPMSYAGVATIGDAAIGLVGLGGVTTLQLH